MRQIITKDLPNIEKKSHWGCGQTKTNSSQTLTHNFYFFRIPHFYEKRCKF
jgi:hypothetical protein